MNFIQSFSEKKSVKEAVSDIKSGISALKPKVVLSFFSSEYNPTEMAGELQAAFPASLTLGCTSSGEIVSGRMLDNSMVAMGFGPGAIADCHAEVVTDLKDAGAVPAAFKKLEAHYKVSMMDMDRKQYFGIILIDGLSGAEEAVMDKISDLTNIVFIGGSAGDDLKFKQTHVMLNGLAMSGCAVLAVIKASVPFDVIKTQSFCSAGKKLTATKVNEAARTVIEFNGKSARKAYAEAAGVGPDDAQNAFMSHPVGLMVSGEPYVRSPQQFKGDDLVFYCNVKNGMELELLNSQDIIRDTAAAVEAKKKEMGGLSAIVNFHCILRTLELKQKNLTSAYGAIFKDIPTVGFSTYGEQLIGHINQTSTMLAFH